MWHEWMVAFALVLVIEGIMPALAPRRFREAASLIGQMDERVLRVVGLLSMMLGAVFIYVLT